MEEVARIYTGGQIATTDSRQAVKLKDSLPGLCCGQYPMIANGQKYSQILYVLLIFVTNTYIQIATVCCQAAKQILPNITFEIQNTPNQMSITPSQNLYMYVFVTNMRSTYKI